MIDVEGALRHQLREAASTVVAGPDLAERVEGRITARAKRARAQRLAGAGIAAAFVLLAGVVAADLGSPPTTTLATPTPRAGVAGWAAVADAPIEARFQHTSVAMDGGVLIFGGYGGDGEPARGAAVYDPVTGAWQEVDDPPGGVSSASAAWTGSQVLVLGADGALSAFDPSTRAWSALPHSPFDATGNAITAVVWTGDQLLVVNNAAGDDGSAPGAAGYDPQAATWRSLPAPPTELAFFDAAWTGNELVAIGDTGASGSGYPSLTAIALDPEAETWRALPEPPLTGVSRRSHGFAAWTGTELVVGGGLVASEEAETLSRELVAEDRSPTDAEAAALTPSPALDAAAWDPATDMWRALPDAPVPTTGLERFAEAWTGAHVVVWEALDGMHRSTGRPVLLDPATGRWDVADPAPGGFRQDAPATWTGSELLIWSGEPTAGDPSRGSCCDPVPTGATFTP